MNCIVTAGPTFEPLDQVRRLTNFSTGQLGSELANHLTTHGASVTLLLGYYSTWRGKHSAQTIETFETTGDLRSRLAARASKDVHAVFHAAAVSDFTFGNLWEQDEQGTMTPCKEKKISTRKGGRLLAELVPTPKIIAEFREWFPSARIVGWKYELDGDQSRAISLGLDQIARNQTHACVVNGAAYGEGFGLVSGDGTCRHVANAPELYDALFRLTST